jgi:hypothetical protein
MLLNLLQRPTHASKLFFEHVPKCGGSSMSDYFRRHYPARLTYEIYGRRPDEQQAFIELPEPVRHAYEFILGHGVRPLLDHCDPGMVAVTIVREPVARIVSHYYFVKATPGHYLHKHVMAEQMTLRDYAASEISTELRNDMVRRFLGTSAGMVEQSPQQAVETAWAELQQRYRVVGVLERLAPAMEGIRAAAGLSDRWKDRRINRTKGKVPIEKVSAEDRRVIEAHNALDIELYRRVEAVAPR